MARDGGLPHNVDAERWVLGSILLNEQLYDQAASDLVPDDFSLEKHRRIFNRMGELREFEESIDRMTVANALLRHNELESCDGLGYLVSLDDGLPEVPNIGSYVRIVKSKSTLRRLIFTGQKMMARAQLEDDTPEAIIESVNEQLLNLSPHSLVEVSSPADIVANYPGGMTEFLDPSKQMPGLPAGFCDIDRLTCGMHAGEFVVIGGRPSMGKTSFAMNIASHVSIQLRQRVVVFSLEMPKESLVQRMACAYGRVDSQRFRHGTLEREERDRLRQAMAAIIESPLLIDDSSSPTFTEIRSKVARIIRRYGPVALVIVDYLQLMNSKTKTENRQQEVSGFSRTAKLTAKALGLPVLVLSQLSRAVEQRKGDHRPMLSDLRESGAIEQDADVVGFLYRGEVYDRGKHELRGKAELILAKNRQGPIGTVHLVWSAPYGRFENAVEEHLYQEADE